MARILQGKSHQWQLGDRPVGSGDAGEVYAASCVDAPEITGVVKKPARVATGGTIQRQAGQIAQEAQALLRLDGLPQGKAHPPRLLDEAPELTTGTANYFIVSESAPGEALDAMLVLTRREAKPFPQRVIMTVLDALFDLFSRAHRAGVLWNDVKLDHIYWHNPTGEVTVIDWGNALFLDQPETSTRPTPPRWEDYRQFVETLGAFLERSSPDLYADLGWEEFTRAELDLPTVSILARRIAYQQEVIALKVMEYQALINVVLAADPDFDGLLAIREYQEILEKIGAPWPRQEVLAYGRNLLQALSSEGDHQGSLRSTSTLFDLFGESLELPWHLLREVYRQPDLISHQHLADLVKQILNQNWTDALWGLAKIGAENKDPSWWRGLVPVLRQKATGLVTPPPYDITQELLARIKSGEEQFQPSLMGLTLNREEWRKMGSDPQKTPFNYSLMETLSEEKSLPHHLRVQLRESYAAGKAAIRELLQAWVELDWEKIERSIKQVLAWDPDRWALMDLANDLESFQRWLKALYEGPEPGTSANAYLQTMLNQKPAVQKILGQPPWYHSLMQMLNLLTSKTGPQPPFNELRNWCPWVLAVTDPPGHSQTPDETTIEETLLHFISHLRGWSDIDAGLQAVIENTPAFHPACVRLAEGFTESLSLNFDPEPYRSLSTHPPHPSLKEGSDSFAIMLHWRMSLSDGDLGAAESTICGSTTSQWQILSHACATTRRWVAVIMPVLRLMLDEKTSETLDEALSQEKTLVAILNEMKKTREIWAEVERTGIHLRWLEALEEAIEKGRTRFLDWRNGFEHSGDRIDRLLYHSQLELIRRNADRWLKLSQHIRLARFHFIKISEGNERKVFRLETLDKILNHLIVVESGLIQDPSARKIPGWQSCLEQIRDTPSSAERQKVVLSLPEDHPLYTWLVDSIF